MFIIGSMIIGGKTLLTPKNEKRDVSASSVYNLRSNDSALINSIIYLLSIKTLFVFKFSASYNYSLLTNFLTIDYDSVVLFTILTTLNDAFVLGNLLFCEFSLGTIMSGFLLLTSLIGSLHVSMLSAD
jgi:hypothetical protein